MIAQLTGLLLRKDPQEVVVDVSGVGYRVAIPLSTFYALGEPGSAVSLRIHTHVREDALALFGFLTPRELQVFERLIAVTGVGPRLAIGILSGIEAAELVTALRGGDVARLTRVPGVGKKTAERLILELRDRLKDLPADEDLPSPPVRDDVASALVHLGYSRVEAERAADVAVKADSSARFEDLLRRSLQSLSSR